MDDALKAAEFETKAVTWRQRALNAAAAARTIHDPHIAAEYRRLATRYSSLCETSCKMAAFFQERMTRQGDA